ncbi:acyl-CoA synthetase [Branchiibius sp. NY16-3462-2]|nr:acyl-CoA synthetase [Branchiibius sp. NY16-3462-2]
MTRRSAQRFPDKAAIIDGDTTLTFAELEATVDRTAAAIVSAGLAKGDRLALLAHNCWQYAVLDFAAARAGVILVPINFMLTASEIAFILQHSGATGFVVEDALIPTAEKAIAEAGPVAVRMAIGAAPDGWSALSQWTSYDGGCPPIDVADDDPVRMMFTSGTESRPKGALLSSRSLMWHYVSCVVGGEMSADDVELHTLPLYHCAQLDCFLGVDVYLGATSIILPAPEPTAVLSAIEKYGVTKFFAPPTVWIGLLRSPAFDSTDLSSLAKGYYGASPMPVAILKEMHERLPETRLWNFYGQTEIAPLGTLLGPEDQVARAGSAGRPALNVETRILDDDNHEVAPGEIGEICHRTPHATLGYYEQPEKTALAFSGGWFHSGDLGYMDINGYLYVVDRKKDMIKTGGENVATREVEEAIYTHPAVAEVAVFAVPHPHWVEAVTAVVVLKDGESATEDDLIAHARGVLAGYKTPKYVVITDALPKNPSGKILKRQLREELADLAQSAS